MKKLITAILILGALTVTAKETYRWVSLTTTGTTTADAVYTAKNNRATSVLAVYQGVTTQTNTCVVKAYISGLTTSEATTYDTLVAVANASAVETVGEGDVTADVDDVLLMPGDILWLDASGADATNVVYKVLIKETEQ